MSDTRYGGEYRQEPQPDATFPSGMCGWRDVCENCPSNFLCYTKAKAEKAAIDALKGEQA